MTTVRITNLQKGETETTPKFHTTIKTLRNTKIQKPKQKLITPGTKKIKKKKEVNINRSIVLKPEKNASVVFKQTKQTKRNKVPK